MAEITRQQAIERVRALRSRAVSTEYLNERLNCDNLAKQIMARHGLSETDVLPQAHQADNAWQVPPTRPGVRYRMNGVDLDSGFADLFEKMFKRQSTYGVPKSGNAGFFESSPEEGVEEERMRTVYGDFKFDAHKAGVDVGNAVKGPASDFSDSVKYFVDGVAEAQKATRQPANEGRGQRRNPNKGKTFDFWSEDEFLRAERKRTGAGNRFAREYHSMDDDTDRKARMMVEISKIMDPSEYAEWTNLPDECYEFGNDTCARCKVADMDALDAKLWCGLTENACGAMTQRARHAVKDGNFGEAMLFAQGAAYLSRTLEALRRRLVHLGYEARYDRTWSVKV